MLAGLQWGKFRSSSDDQLLPIRQLELFKSRSQVLADSTMDDKEKKAKVEKIDAQLETLSSQMAAVEKNVASAH